MATPLLFNYNYNTNFPLNWKELYFERIDFALSFQGDQNLTIAPLIEASRMAFLLKKPLLCLKYLAELQAVLPDYAWIYYFHARIFLDESNSEQALLSLEKAVDCALKSPELLRQFVLPVIENGNTCDYRRITDYMWQSVRHHNNEFQTNALLHLACELTGYIYQTIGKPNQAMDSYSKAIDYIPIPDCIYRLNRLLIQSSEFEKLLHWTDKGLDNSPYDTILILYKVFALIQLKQRQIATKVLKDHRRALISFVNVRKIVIIRYLISLLQVLVFFGRQPASKFIIEFTRVLRNKLGFTYLA
jgi:tetratricopeptide (TPR) repeat protein